METLFTLVIKWIIAVMEELENDAKTVSEGSWKYRNEFVFNQCPVNPYVTILNNAP